MRPLNFAVSLGFLAWMTAGAAETAAEVPAATPPPDEEVIVIGDKFARWDHTRWYAEMQIGFPIPFQLYARLNTEFRATAMQVRTSLYCEKTFRRGRHQYEVLCDIEEVGLRATAYEKFPKDPDGLLHELDDLLTAAQIRLYVSDDGRVTNVDFENFPANNDREKVIRESMRQIFLRLVASFHMTLPRDQMLREGQWVEYESPLFLLPSITVTTSAAVVDGSTANTGEASFASFSSLGGSYLIHQLDRYRGHNVVQSVGKATVTDGTDGDDITNYFACKYDGVSIYNEDGIMTERVYALKGQATASSALADGFGGAIYFQSGRMRMLDRETKVDVGFTGRVLPPKSAPTPGTPVWVPME